MIEEPPLLILYNKPFGIITSIGDPYGRPNLESVYKANTNLTGFHPVGRLDRDTSGLLLFSKDGQLTQHLLNPSSGIMRVYEAYVLGKVDNSQLSARLTEGVTTTEGTFPATLLHSEQCSIKV